MDARGFLPLAEVLAKDVSGRTLLTPGLDAAFHVAHEFLDRIKVVVGQSPQTHVTVQHALNNSGDATLAAASSQPRAPYTERPAADYDSARPPPEQPARASATLALATDVIDRLDRLAAGTATVPFDPVAAAAAVLNWAAVTGKTNVRPK
jgi:hypothetical protein